MPSGVGLHQNATRSHFLNSEFPEIPRLLAVGEYQVNYPGRYLDNIAIYSFHHNANAAGKQYPAFDLSTCRVTGLDLCQSTGDWRIGRLTGGKCRSGEKRQRSFDPSKHQVLPKHN